MIELDTRRLDALIQRSGVSINDLAAAADVSPEYIWKLRHGKAPNVSAIVLARLADALGVSVDYLLGIEGNKPAPAPELITAIEQVNHQTQNARLVIARIVTDIIGLMRGQPAEVETDQPMTDDDLELAGMFREMTPETKRALLAYTRRSAEAQLAAEQRRDERQRQLVDF